MVPSDRLSLLAPEARGRVLIDAQLAAAGWAVQDRQTMNPITGPSAGVPEKIMAVGHGRADYRLPDKDRCFTQMYGVNKLTRAGMPSPSVVIHAIQRVYSVPRDQRVADADDPDSDKYTPDAPKTVDYDTTDDVIATSARIAADDLHESPFTERGGADALVAAFDGQSQHYLDELNGKVAA